MINLIDTLRSTISELPVEVLDGDRDAVVHYLANESVELLKDTYPPVKAAFTACNTIAQAGSVAGANVRDCTAIADELAFRVLKQLLESTGLMALIDGILALWHALPKAIRQALAIAKKLVSEVGHVLAGVAAEAWKGVKNLINAAAARAIVLILAIAKMLLEGAEEAAALVSSGVSTLLKITKDGLTNPGQLYHDSVEELKTVVSASPPFASTLQNEANQFLHSVGLGALGDLGMEIEGMVKKAVDSVLHTLGEVGGDVVDVLTFGIL